MVKTFFKDVTWKILYLQGIEISDFYFE